MADLIKKSDGEVLYAADLNTNAGTFLRGEGQNTIQQLQDRAITFTADGGIFAEAYVDADGRNGDVNTGLTGATFDTDKYKFTTFPTGTEPFVIVEASSLSIGWDDNDCLSQYLGSGRWIIYCTTGTDEVRRAQIYKSMFYGTNGSNPLMANFSTVTAVKTSITRDIGKRGHYASLSSTGTGYYTGTFVDTSTNDDCSSWSYVLPGTTSGNYGRWEMPSGTTLHQHTYDGSSSDETGTDTTADELNNPATCQLESVATLGRTTYVKSFILCSGDITWVASGTATESNTDFYTDYAIPDMTDGSSETFETSLITHDIPTGTFSSTISSSFLTFKAEDWEAGADVQYKLTGTGGAEDTGWLDTNEIVEFTAFTAEPDTLIVKLIPKTTSPTAGKPAINGIYLTGDKP